MLPRYPARPADGNWHEKFIRLSSARRLKSFPRPFFITCLAICVLVTVLPFLVALLFLGYKYNVLHSILNYITELFLCSLLECPQLNS